MQATIEYEEHAVKKGRNKHSKVESDHIEYQNHPKLGRVRYELVESEALIPFFGIEELVLTAERYHIQTHLL